MVVCLALLATRALASSHRCVCFLVLDKIVHGVLFLVERLFRFAARVFIPDRCNFGALATDGVGHEEAVSRALYFRIVDVFHKMRLEHFGGHGFQNWRWVPVALDSMVVCIFAVRYREIPLRF